jgi:hypothetical protein
VRRLVVVVGVAVVVVAVVVAVVVVCCYTGVNVVVVNAFGCLPAGLGNSSTRAHHFQHNLLYFRTIPWSAFRFEEDDPRCRRGAVPSISPL